MFTPTMFSRRRLREVQDVIGKIRDVRFAICNTIMTAHLVKFLQESTACYNVLLYCNYYITLYYTLFLHSLMSLVYIYIYIHIYIYMLLLL